MFGPQRTIEQDVMPVGRVKIFDRSENQPGVFNLFAPDKDFFIRVGQLGASTLRLGPAGSPRLLTAGGLSTCAAPTVSPAQVTCAPA